MPHIDLKKTPITELNHMDFRSENAWIAREGMKKIDDHGRRIMELQELVRQLVASNNELVAALSAKVPCPCKDKKNKAVTNG